MIKKFSNLLILLLLMTAYSCKKDVESYLFTRPTHPKNFKTIQDGDLYAYTGLDSALRRADYFIRLQGYLANYGEGKIVQYGHCWKKNAGAGAAPNISDSKLMTEITSPIPPVADSISFESLMLDLEPNTEYSVASYVIIESERDGKKVRTVGYNPDVSYIKTRPATNEWFEQYDNCPDPAPFPPIKAAARFDAVGGSLNDTLLFFGTGSQGYGNPLLADIKVFSNNHWVAKTSIPASQTKGLPMPGMMDGIAFAMSYRKKNAAEGKMTHSIFLGYGDHGGQGRREDKSDFLLEYDLDTDQWYKRNRGKINRRSGAVCFVLGKYAYIGTGEGSTSLEYNWYVFDPVKASSDDKKERTQGLRLMNVSKTIKIPRKGAVAFVVNGRGYFGLGTDGNGHFFKDFYRFTPANSNQEPTEGTWERIEDFPGEPRANAVAFNIGDLAYVGTGDNLVRASGAPYEFMERENQWEGEVFSDFYRFNPYTERWRKVADYTSNEGKLEGDQRLDAIRPITRAVGMAYEEKEIGLVGYGIIPNGYTGVKNEPHQTSTSNAQRDFWKYQPMDKN